MTLCYLYYSLYIVLHNITLHYMTLHYIMFYYIVLFIIWLIMRKIELEWTEIEESKCLDLCNTKLSFIFVWFIMNHNGCIMSVQYYYLYLILIFAFVVVPQSYLDPICISLLVVYYRFLFEWESVSMPNFNSQEGKVCLWRDFSRKTQWRSFICWWELHASWADWLS